jgi:hypothetical protein
MPSLHGAAARYCERRAPMLCGVVCVLADNDESTSRRSPRQAAACHIGCGGCALTSNAFTTRGQKGSPRNLAGWDAARVSIQAIVWHAGHVGPCSDRHIASHKKCNRTNHLSHQRVTVECRRMTVESSTGVHPCPRAGTSSAAKGPIAPWHPDCPTGRRVNRASAVLLLTRLANVEGRSVRPRFPADAGRRGGKRPALHHSR